MTSENWSLMASAHAQDAPVEKKNLLGQKVILEDITFIPNIGSDGFSVVSSFDMTKLSCDQFSNESHQMAVLLYPTDSFNEQFLIKVRDCVLKLKEGHPLKHWLKWVARPARPEAKEHETFSFMTEVINSPFNLITDLKLKYRIIQTLAEIPEETMPEKVLKAYLFLMIGNVSKSDNIIRAFTNETPYHNWQGFSSNQSSYHKLARVNLDKLLQKLFNHPADRRSVELFGLYLTRFYNDPSLIKIVTKYKSGKMSQTSLGLRYVESISPNLVHFLRFENSSEKRRIKQLRNFIRFPLKEQSYWEWAFLDIEPLISDAMLPELVRLEKEDKLWFIYLMDNEKLSDWFITKTQKSYLPGKRQYLRSLLDNEKLFMLSLYKLIEAGDIDKDLIQKVSAFLSHD